MLCLEWKQSFCLILYFTFFTSTATIFASLLLKSPAKQDLAEKRRTQEFFHHFLTQWTD